jgi:hypothetical protein
LRGNVACGPFLQGQGMGGYVVLTVNRRILFYLLSLWPAQLFTHKETKKLHGFTTATQRSHCSQATSPTRRRHLLTDPIEHLKLRNRSICS